MKYQALRAILLIGFCLNSGADDLAAKVDSFVRAEMASQKIPGVALLVNRNGTNELVRGYGLSNIELQVPVKPETIFQSGSVGKQFTSAAVMMLVEEGKIDLEASVKKHLPEAPASWEAIKIRHLLTHTSGLGDYPGDFSLQRDYTEEELLKRFMATSLAFKPGEKFAYSNLGYATLGILIGKVTGKFYGTFLQDRIFKPLDMVTARIISEADVIPNRAAGYRLEKGELKNQEWVSPSLNTTADGALYLTVYDLAKWDAALFTEKLMRKDRLEQMWTTGTLNDGKSHSYGMGWFVVSINGHRLVHHGGAWQGFQCGIQRYIDDRLTVIAFDNLAGSNIERILRGVAAHYIPEVRPDWMKVEK